MATTEQSQTLTPNAQLYLLGHSYDEERRLKRQAEELRQESARLPEMEELSVNDRRTRCGSG